jgi:hypothetical protein
MAIQTSSVAASPPPQLSQRSSSRGSGAGDVRSLTKGKGGVRLSSKQSSPTFTTKPIVHFPSSSSADSDAEVQGQKNNAASRKFGSRSWRSWTRRVTPATPGSGDDKGGIGATRLLPFVSKPSRPSWKSMAISRVSSIDLEKNASGPLQQPGLPRPILASVAGGLSEAKSSPPPIADKSSKTLDNVTKDYVTSGGGQRVNSVQSGSAPTRSAVQCGTCSSPSPSNASSETIQPIRNAKVAQGRSAPSSVVSSHSSSASAQSVIPASEGRPALGLVQTGTSSPSSPLPTRKVLRSDGSDDDRLVKKVESRTAKIRPDTARGRFIRPGFFLSSRQSKEEAATHGDGESKLPLINSKEAKRDKLSTLLSSAQANVERRENAMVSLVDSVIFVSRNDVRVKGQEVPVRKTTLADHFKEHQKNEEEGGDQIERSESKRNEIQVGSTSPVKGRMSPEPRSTTFETLEGEKAGESSTKSMVFEESPPIFRKVLIEKSKNLSSVKEKAGNEDILEETDQKPLSRPLSANSNSLHEVSQDEMKVASKTGPTSTISSLKTAAKGATLAGKHVGDICTKTEKFSVSISDLLISC